RASLPDVVQTAPLAVQPVSHHATPTPTYLTPHQGHEDKDALYMQHVREISLSLSL
ncbi:hypothetical protein KIPB_014852, partial [Kipferlia bialata]